MFRISFLVTWVTCFFFLFKMTFFKLILSMIKYENTGSLNLTGHILSVHGMYTATGC